MQMKWNVGLFIIVFLTFAFLKLCGFMPMISWLWVCAPLFFSAFVFFLEWLVDVTEEND